MTFFRRPFRSRALKQDFVGLALDGCLRIPSYVGEEEGDCDSREDSDPDRGMEERDEEGFEPRGGEAISTLEPSSATRTSPKAIAKGSERVSALDM